MKTEILSQKPKFGIAFLAVFLIVTPIVLWFSTPWRWDLPWPSKWAGCVGLPVIFSIGIYIPLEFARVLISNKSIGRNEIAASLITLAYILVGTTLISFVGFFRNNRFFAVAFLGFTSILLFNFLKAEKFERK